MPAEFVEHPSLKPLQLFLRSYLVGRLAELRSGEGFVKPCAAEIYAVSVMDRVCELDEAVASIRLAKGFIRDLGPEALATSRTYRYHYENYLFRSVGIVDRAHRLVGASLKLDTRKYEAARGNQYVQKYVSEHHPEIYAELMSINDTVSNKRFPRNKIVHSAAFSSRELGLFSAAEVFNVDIPPGIEIDKLMKDYFSAEEEKISEFLVKTMEFVSSLLDSLAKIFNGEISGIRHV